MVFSIIFVVFSVILYFVICSTEIKIKAGEKDLLQMVTGISNSVSNGSSKKTLSMFSGQTRKQTASNQLDFSIDVKHTFDQKQILARNDTKDILKENKGVSENSVKMLKPASNSGSPVPCGDSFFEDDAVLTQTHVEFMSKFKRHSLNGRNNSNTASPLASTKINTSTPYTGNRYLAVNSSNKRNTFLDTSTLNGQFSRDSYVHPIQVNEEDDFGQDLFDSVDEELNLQLAKNSVLDNYPEMAVGSIKGSDPAVVVKGDNPSYPEEISRDNFIDEFEEDEDFNEILTEDKLIGVSRSSFGMSR